MGHADHFVQFYERDPVMLDAVGGYIGAGLRSGEAGLIIATHEHRQRLERRLLASGINVSGLESSGSFFALDAGETLAQFMINGRPDPARFDAAVGSVVATAAQGGRHVRAFGEMVALLVADGNESAAIQLEALWNDLQDRSHAFSLFCAYPMASLGEESLGEAVRMVCAEHSQVIPAESYMHLDTPAGRLREVAVLQQKARALEAEVEERKNAEDQLRVALAMERAAREETQAALRLRDEFLSVASHELRTPLTALNTQAQLALRRIEQNGHLDPERVVHALRTISGQGDRLARLLTQLLDISRLEAGKLSAELAPTDLCDLVDGIVRMAEPWTERHTITVERPDSLQAMVDSLRLEQVVTNLLDNAVKYSPNGGSIEVVVRETGSGLAELSVRDHGLGIPPEKRAGIFERFYQAHSDGYRSGLGLGLYISRSIVEMHGGEILAEFPPDGGTRIVVRLPINRAA
jgi:signal transduction histidine kinase